MYNDYRGTILEQPKDPLQAPSSFKASDNKKSMCPAPVLVKSALREAEWSK